MNDLEKNVLQTIGESVDSPDVFTDDSTGMAPIRDSINDGIQELCLLTGSYRKMYHLPLLENRQFYRISARQDYWAYVIEVWDRTRHRKLTQTSLLTLAAREPDFMSNQGYPEEYGQIGLDYLFFHPYPTAKGTVLEITYVAIPKPYTTDTDPIRLREMYQRATVCLAVSEYYASRGDAPRATECLAKYLETAGLMQLNPMTAERVFTQGRRISDAKNPTA